MALITKKRYIYVNSGNQLNATNNSFIYNVNIPTDEGYDAITLTQADIPISYYLVQNGFNTFTLTENKTSVIISLTPGNYNVNSFLNVLTNALNASSPNGLTYKVLFPNNYNDSNTGKYTFYSNSSIAVSFTFDSNNSLNEQFGFDKGVTVSFDTASIPGVGVLVSSNVVKFVSEDTLYIHCDNLMNYGGYFSDVLQEVYNGTNSIPYSILSYVNPAPFENSKKLSGIPKFFTFSITNENGTPIFFNGLNVVFTILVYNSREYYNYIEGVKNEIKNEIKVNLELLIQTQNTLNESLIRSFNFNFENLIRVLESQRSEPKPIENRIENKLEPKSIEPIENQLEKLKLEPEIEREENQLEPEIENQNKDLTENEKFLLLNDLLSQN